jgi:ABC-type cobalamin transport system permease subunit
MLLTISLASLSLALYIMQREIKQQMYILFGYTVMGVGFKKKHYSLTRADALEWLGCYDNAVMYKGRKLYSERRTLKA